MAVTTICFVFSAFLNFSKVSEISLLKKKKKIWILISQGLVAD